MTGAHFNENNPRVKCTRCAGDRKLSSAGLRTLHTALDQLPDDVTGIQHSRTHLVQAAQPVQSEPSSRPPSGPPTEKEATLEEFNALFVERRLNEAGDVVEAAEGVDVLEDGQIGAHRSPLGGSLVGG